MDRLAPRCFHLADSHQLFAEGLQRLHDRLKDEVASLLIGMPRIGPHATREVDRAEAERGLGRCRQSRHHSVHERQCDGSAHGATHKSATRKMLLRDEHGYSLAFDFTTFAATAGPLRAPADSVVSNFVRIWKGALSIIPMTIEDSR